ncbi:MAG: GatB/YqeY domain-containing protein [Gammaproteobacteria bacterium]|nr:GatB/YqeY domain-containing protein [Gammaproteobacteria bacterium]MCY4281500.1 GatB/YqeY domain-containing protein [Gammaproteobacteria bacterium]MCY4338517.1 GatB/YqeY domain-containing protein [Gammaproteobacteria bacterium]
MSELKHRINEDVKSAMRSKDKERLAALRLISAAIKQREIDERINLDDAQVSAVLNKMAKQQRDSIEQYASAGRDDLVKKEQFELSIILGYLPQPLDAAQISAKVAEAIAATGAVGMKDMGKVMGQLQAALQGRADLSQVSALVKARLNQ